MTNCKMLSRSSFAILTLRPCVAVLISSLASEQEHIKFAHGAAQHKRALNGELPFLSRFLIYSPAVYFV